MADESKTDLLMKFVLKGKGVAAECALDIGKDQFMTGFRAAPYQDYSNFFQILDFSFGLKAHENEAGAGGHLGHSGQASSRMAGEYARWRSLTDQQVREQAASTDPNKTFYPIELGDFSFTRLIDSASPIFFQCCCNSITFDSAAMVKRVSRGDGTSLGYLRLDFQEVLITRVNWDDGDVVRESCSCISRHCRIAYRSQKAAGDLVKPMQDAVWEQDPLKRAVWPKLS